MIVALFGTLALPAGSTGASKWSVMQLPAKQLEGGYTDQVPLNGVSCPSAKLVSCPSVSLCIAVSGGNGSASGRIFTTTSPIAGRWQSHQLGGSPDLRAASCTKTFVCVAVAKGGRIFISADPTGGAGAWREVGSPTPRDLEGISCVAAFLCAAGDGGGNILTSTDPAGSVFAVANGGGSVQITGVTCPTTTNCVAVDNNADVLTSTNPDGGSKAWTFENLVPFEAEPADHGQFVKNALWGASCPSTSLCVLVGANSRIFSATDPFASPGGSAPDSGSRKRPRTHLVFAEGFWKSTVTRHRRVKARFHFYSRDGARTFACRRDRGPWRRCHSPLRYRVAIGRHTLRVRAVGSTGLRGPAAVVRFKVDHRPPPARQ